MQPIENPPRLSCGRAATSGFTLVELMVTVVVLSIVLAMAVPSFSSMINRNRLAASANEAVAAFQVARMEAVRRNARVVLCPSANGSACAGGDWSRLIVFSDNNGNGSPGDANEEIIRDVVLAAGGVSIKPSGNVATNQRISFGADGFARVGNAGARVGGLSVCSTKLPSADNTRDITVAVSRIAVASRDGSDACSAMSN
ncbi:MAG: GspH/FimT family pseudopilin [Xanthomonadales bacterium]|nr:GspH/FimT family pseudopilin [Xanthomonadales bacterium]